MIRTGSAGEVTERLEFLISPINSCPVNANFFGQTSCGREWLVDLDYSLVNECLELDHDLAENWDVAGSVYFKQQSLILTYKK
jgi:hypothetical protein